MQSEFVCDKCGLCCQNLMYSERYGDLDDGTGVCIYYDKETHLCTIYDHRPKKCNVKASYEDMADIMSYEEYLRLNYEACEHLKKGVK